MIRLLTSMAFEQTTFAMLPLKARRLLDENLAPYGLKTDDGKDRATGFARKCDERLLADDPEFMRKVQARKRADRREEERKTELRIDPSDGNPYSKVSFKETYGGLREWNAAPTHRPVSARGPAPPPLAPRPSPLPPPLLLPLLVRRRNPPAPPVRTPRGQSVETAARGARARDARQERRGRREQERGGPFAALRIPAAAPLAVPGPQARAARAEPP